MKNNENRRNREKKEEKLDTSISNHEIGFLNILRFIAFITLVTFKSFVIRLWALFLCHNIKKFSNLWYLVESIYEAKLIMYRSSHLEVFCKIGVLRHFIKFTTKNLCWSVFFNKVASLHPVALLKKNIPAQVFLITWFL